MSYKIGSFNVRNLSLGAGRKRDLARIAKIIKQFDIVALQEVLSNGKILEGVSSKNPSVAAKAYEYSLRRYLGDNWDMCWLDPQTASKWYPYIGNDSRGEGYAFLWRKDKFQCPVNDKGKEIRPRIIHQYRVNSSKGELRLIRDPGYGRFQLVNMPNLEIRLITVHLVYTKPSPENLLKDIAHGAATLRKNEFKVLARNIYTSISDDRRDVKPIVPYTIILGDYNLNLSESGAGYPHVRKVLYIDSDKNIINPVIDVQSDKKYVLHTKQSMLSTVNRDADGYASNFDHFTYDQRAKNIVSSPPMRLDVIEDGDFKKYKEEVSDHIPIMLEIDFKHGGLR